MKLTRIIFLKTTLLAAMTVPTLILPAHGQQDVNPTWYNPWPDALKPADNSAPAKITRHKDARVTHNDRAPAIQAKRKQTPVQEPVRTAEAVPPKK